MQSLITDTLAYVKAVVKGVEKSEKVRKQALKKKMKLRRRGISVPIGDEGDVDGTKAAGLIFARRRLFALAVAMNHPAVFIALPLRGLRSLRE